MRTLTRTTRERMAVASALAFALAGALMLLCVTTGRTTQAPDKEQATQAYAR